MSKHTMSNQHLDTAVGTAARALPAPGRVSESIYNGASVVVPMADVSHFEKWSHGGLLVITKHTRWDKDTDFWANNVFIPEAEKDGFVRAWTMYRHELEFDTLADLSPAAEPKVQP